MSVGHPRQPINWLRVISDSDPPDLSRIESVRRQGIRFHKWLQETYETDSVPFERDLDWLTDPGENGGRFDCFDGHFVYEFKTVAWLPDRPRQSDVEQLGRYLKALEAEFGVVVYVERSGFDGAQFIIER